MEYCECGKPQFECAGGCVSKTHNASESPGADLLGAIVDELEYAAFYLCESSDDELEPGVVESTCPERTLFLAIRKLKAIRT